MEGDISQLVQLGPTAVVALVAFWAIVEVLKLKRSNGRGNGDIMRAIDKLSTNHLGEVNVKLDGLKDRQLQMIDKLDKIVSLLTEINVRDRKRNNHH